MTRKGRTAIVVPCYNEAQRIQRDEFIGCCDLLSQVSFIFINDASTDKTGEILDSLMRARPGQAAVVTLEQNSGKAEAVRQGMLAAFREKYDYVGFWDADLATPLSSIETFYNILENSPGADIVMGARVKLLGRSISRKAFRHYIGRVFATFASMMLHLPVYDTQCGAKLFRNSPHVQQIFEEPFLAKWIFDVEILARYIAMGDRSLQEITSCAIIEYPLETWSDVPGSKLRLKDFFGSGLELFRIWFRYREDLLLHCR
jgi:glycosyltransferase involved in cell wall biosynthesis